MIETPTMSETIAQVQSDMAGEGVTRVWLSRSLERALAVAVGLVGWLFYDRQTKSAMASSPYRAIGSDLDEWGRLKGVTRSPASTATGLVSLTGTPGSTQPAGSILNGPEDQVYTLDDDIVIQPVGSDTEYVTCSVTGEIGNLDSGATLTVETPASGINSTASIPNFINGGSDDETDAAYRLRVLTAWRYPATFGTAADFEAVAIGSDSAITRAWAFSLGYDADTPGLVDLVVAGPASAVGVSGAVVGIAQVAIDAVTHVGTVIDVASAIATATPVTLALTPTASTTANKAIVETYMLALNGTTTPGETLLNGTIQAAAARAGFAIQVQDIDGDGTGTSDISTTAPDIATIGTITWGTWA